MSWWFPIVAGLLLLEARRDKLKRCKQERNEYGRKMQSTLEQISIQNKFIATLTHEMRNFVAVYPRLITTLESSAMPRC